MSEVVEAVLAHQDGAYDGVGGRGPIGHKNAIRPDQDEASALERVVAAVEAARAGLAVA